jgi:hypothetical protein
MIRAGRLFDEIERIRQVLVRLHMEPNTDKETQREMVSHASKLFQALLLAKETIKKTVLIE